MPLIDRIEEDYKKAFKARQADVVSTLRMLRAALKNWQIDSKEEFTDENVLKIISSEVKKRKDSIVEYERGNRPDLAEKEKAEMDLLMKYMPEQMGEEEVRKIIRDKISSLGLSGPGDFGKLMGAAMGELKAKADGGMISRIAKEELGK